MLTVELFMNGQAGNEGTKLQITQKRVRRNGQSLIKQFYMENGHHYLLKGCRKQNMENV